MGYGSVVALFGTLGDLFESLIKRTCSVKDAGHLIPGHGGILDRIDSLLTAVPAAYLYLIIFLSF
jgi:phosphatidate cytidylyltransferase